MPQCPKCDRDLIEVRKGDILRWGEDEIRKGDRYHCDSCDEDIWIDLCEPYRAQMHCGVCDRIFSSVSLYYGHLDDIKDHDRCSECHEMLVYDNYFGHYEDRGEGISREFIPTGYRCLCGHLEEW